MESLENGKQELLSGIKADVLSEKQQIIDDAAKQVAEKKKYAEKKIESILNDARKQAQEKAEIVKRKITSSVGLEIKRRRLRVRDEVVKSIVIQVEKKIESLIAKDAYRNYLVNWITEASLGLGAESAQINASQQEKQLIDQPLISDVKEKLQACTGKAVELELSQLPALNEQGVVLISCDGRTCFNNQVKTRIMRNERVIRNLLYESLFKDD